MLQQAQIKMDDVRREQAERQTGHEMLDLAQQRLDQQP